MHKPKIEKFEDALGRVKKEIPSTLATDLDCLLFNIDTLRQDIIAFRDAAATSSRTEQRRRLFRIQIGVDQDLKPFLRNASRGLRKVLGPLP